jgi:hypothetical protein
VLLLPRKDYRPLSRWPYVEGNRVVLERPSKLVQCRVSSCLSTEKLEMSGGSSAEPAALLYAFAALAPARACFPSSRLSFASRRVRLDQVSRERIPSKRLAQDAALPIVSHQLHQMDVRTGKAKVISHFIVHSSTTHSHPMQNPN